MQREQCRDAANAHYCTLPKDHDGAHKDGDAEWVRHDGRPMFRLTFPGGLCYMGVRPIFGTVSAAEPIRFIQGALLTDHEADVRAGRALEAHYAAQPKRKITAESVDPIRAALVETLRFSDPAKPLFRYGDRAITGPEMVALLDARNPIAEDFVADVLFGAVQAVKSIDGRAPVPAALQLITGPQGITLLFEGLVLKQLHRHPDNESIRIRELAAYLREFAEVFEALTTDDFRRKFDGAIFSRKIGGECGDLWVARILDEGQGCAWGFGIRANRIHQTAHPVATVEEGQRAALAMAHRVAGEAWAILRGMEGSAASTPEPPPTPGTGDVWQSVIERLPPGRLRDACVERRAFGLKKYGTVLQANNGRNWRADALQEALDLIAYSAQGDMEEDPDATAILVRAAELAELLLGGEE